MRQSGSNDESHLRVWRVSRKHLSLYRLCALALVILLSCATPSRSWAFAVLAHEAIIDSAWEMNIRPLLLERFPGSTPEQIKEAHAYAYGGSIIQDMGYYPHGSFFFSDLAHYVRSGDFVLALLRDSSDIDGYAFALGALAHYAADVDGHSIGTNPAVPLLYPKLRRKYGDWITYGEDPLAHVKTEFGFDVLQIAQGRYASQGYHDFIGFSVAGPLLEQAFRETYGLDLKSVLPDEAAAFNSYRHDVSIVIPKATRIAWALKKDQIQKDQPSMTKKKFLYNLSRASYQKSWGKHYRHTTFQDEFLALCVRIMPKIGPLKALELRTPTPEAEHMFEASFNAALSLYRKGLAQSATGLPELPNVNLDTGGKTAPGQYRLNDETHAKLLDALARDHFGGASRPAQAELLEFYADPAAPYATKRKPKAWAKLQSQLEELKKANSESVARVPQGDSDLPNAASEEASRSEPFGLTSLY